MHSIKVRCLACTFEHLTEHNADCTAKVKALADVRPIAIDDADSIIRAFHRNLKMGKPIQTVDLLPNATEEEKKKLAEAERIDAGVPEKQALDAEVEKQIQNGITA